MQKLIKRNQPDYSTQHRDNCLSNILTKHNDETCEKKYATIQNTVWIQLQSGNQWIGIAPKIETLHILCKDNIPRHEDIYGNIILTIAPDCEGISLSATMKPNNIINNASKSYEIITASINLPNLTIHETDIPKDLLTVNILDKDSMQHMGKTLEELQGIADKIFQHQRIKTWKEKFYEYLAYAGYIALAGILIVFLYKIGLFNVIIKTLRLLCGHCYHNCSFGNNAPTQHITYTPKPHESKPDRLLFKLNKI